MLKLLKTESCRMKLLEMKRQLEN